MPADKTEVGVIKQEETPEANDKQEATAGAEEFLRFQRFEHTKQEHDLRFKYAPWLMIGLVVSFVCIFWVLASKLEHGNVWLVLSTTIVTFGYITGKVFNWVFQVKAGSKDASESMPSSILRKIRELLNNYPSS